MIFNLRCLNNWASFTRCIFSLCTSCSVLIVWVSAWRRLDVLWFTYKNPLQLLLLRCTWLKDGQVVRRIVTVTLVWQADVFILRIIWIPVFPACILVHHTLLWKSRPDLSTIIWYLVFFIIFWLWVPLVLSSLTSMHAESSSLFNFVRCSRKNGSVVHHLDCLVNLVDIVICPLVVTLSFFFVVGLFPWFNLENLFLTRSWS